MSTDLISFINSTTLWLASSSHNISMLNVLQPKDNYVRKRKSIADKPSPLLQFLLLHGFFFDPMKFLSEELYGSNARQTN